MSELDDNSIDVIITSPPYNKIGLNGYIHETNRKFSPNIIYGKNQDLDNMPEEQYQEWQIDFLNECHRVLKPDGSMFYNHKNRIYKGEIISPYQWLLKSNFKIRQEIIWDRRSTNNVRRCRFLPTTELIFWLTKGIPSFDRKQDTPFKNEVWSFPFERNNPHPAPYPIELPDNILRCIPNEGDKKVVLDPFMGSGTTAIAAIKNGFNYIGFDIVPEFIDMANMRISEYVR